MRWRITSILLMACTALGLLVNATTPPPGGEALQQSTPLPRPTLSPTEVAEPQPQPTAPAQPQPTPKPAKPRREKADPLPGHITGTVIDQTTGAPVPGVLVNISGKLVRTDANGNYGHWLVPGDYMVALALEPEQGWPEQNPLWVTLDPEEWLVAHLYFSSPMAAEVQVAPAAEPEQADTDDAVPALLPAGGQPLPIRPQQQQPVPQQLPNTAAQPDSTLMLWLWLGVMLLAGGAWLSTRKVSRERMAAVLPGFSATIDPNGEESITLLAALLAVDVRRIFRPAQPTEDRALLEKLLDEEK